MATIEFSRLLTFTWNWITAGVAANTSDVVEVTFTPTVDGCRVDLIHTLDPRAGDGADLRQGWSDTLESLVTSTES